MPDREPKREIVEHEGEKLLGHIIECMGEYDVRGLAAHLDYLLNQLEQGRGSHVARFSDGLDFRQAEAFIRDANDKREGHAAEVPFASGTSGDRLYFRYSKKDHAGSLWIPHDPKADEGNISMRNVARLFGYDHFVDSALWDVAGYPRECIRVNFLVDNARQVKIVPLDQ